MILKPMESRQLRSVLIRVIRVLIFLRIAHCKRGEKWNVLKYSDINTKCMSANIKNVFTGQIEIISVCYCQFTEYRQSDLRTKRDLVMDEVRIIYNIDPACKNQVVIFIPQFICQQIFVVLESQSAIRKRTINTPNNKVGNNPWQRHANG